MFNLLVSYSEESWETGTYKMPKARFCEYTDSDIRERYLDIASKSIKDELISLPCLFVTENETRDSFVGKITSIADTGNEIKIKFIPIEEFKPIPSGTLDSIYKFLDMKRFELSRTHWAIKDIELLDILSTKGLIAIDEPTQELKIDSIAGSDKDIFIIHGHDSALKYEVSDFIIELGLNPIILHEQASGGLTIIEKIEKYSRVGFAIALYSPCDIGGKKEALPKFNYRARQNVIFEHGYLIGKLGRNRVCALVKDEIETPNDISGVVYIKYDKDSHWKTDVLSELSSLNIEFHQNNT